MAYIDQHMEDTEKYLGKSMQKLHAWLDQYSRVFEPAVFSDYHRSFLHNSYGLELITDRWGVFGRDAFLIHLYRDWLEHPISYHLSTTEVLFEAKKILIYFNNLSNFDIDLKHFRHMEESLCSIAFKEVQNDSFRQ